MRYKFVDNKIRFIALNSLLYALAIELKNETEQNYWRNGNVVGGGGILRC